MSSLSAPVPPFEEGRVAPFGEEHAFVEPDLVADSDPIRPPIPIAAEKWPLSAGFSGRIPSESAVGFDWNRWSDSVGAGNSSYSV
jgi:hypothetical protein